MSTPYNNIKGKEFWTSQTSQASYKKPKTMLRISFPPGESMKLLNLAEISAPGGMSLLFKLPFPMSEGGLSSLAESIKKSGGTVEIVNN